MNKADVDEKVKATYILCYGYVSLYAPVALIVSRLETSIIKVLTTNFPIAKVCAMFLFCLWNLVL